MKIEEVENPPVRHEDSELSAKTSEIDPVSMWSPTWLWARWALKRLTPVARLCCIKATHDLKKVTDISLQRYSALFFNASMWKQYALADLNLLGHLDLGVRATKYNYNYVPSARQK